MTDAKLTEKVLHKQVCSWIDSLHPNIIYTSDMSGVRTSIGIAMEIKRKTCKRYKIPDLIILHPAGGYHGLIIEVKTSRDEVYKKDGTMKANKHIEAQSKSLERLRELGYMAEFGCGFKGCIEKIQNYLTQKCPIK